MSGHRKKGIAQFIMLMIGGLAILGGAVGIAYKKNESSFGAAPLIFRSGQVGSGATNGDILTTDGSASSWVTPASLGLTGGGTGSVGTSTTPIIGQIPYWTTSGATPELLGSVATSTPTVGTGLSYTGTLGKLIGGISGTLSVDLSPFSTSDLSEGTNLYYTDARVNSYLTGTSTLGAHIDAGSYVYPKDGDYHSAPYYVATSTTATSTFAGGLRGQKGIQFDTLVSCDTIDTDANGFLTCGTDATGAGASPWTDAGSYVYTTANEYVEAPYFLATSTTATSTFVKALMVGTSEDTGITLSNGANPTLKIGGGDASHIFNGSTYTSLMEVHSAGATDPAGLTIHNHGDANAGASAQTFLRSRGTHASPTSVADGTILGRLAFSGYDGTDYMINALISAQIDGTPGANDGPTSLTFSTSPDGSNTALERMTIEPNGNIGIGNSVPSSLLNVQGEVSAKYFTATSTTATSTFPALSITGAVSMMGEVFSNFTTYVRSLFTGGSHITITNGSIAVNDDFLLNTGDTGTGTYDFSGATVKQHVYPSWTWPGYATTTTATTTVPLGSAFTAESWSFTVCRTTSGSVGYRYGDGTNFTTYLIATTTESRYALTTNNTFTTDERRVVEVGPLTAAQITCTVDKIVNN